MISVTCHQCHYTTLVKDKFAPNDTYDARGCLSLPIEKLTPKTSTSETACSWNVARESFEVSEPGEKEESKKIWRLVPTGIVGFLRFGKGKPNTCEILDVDFSNLEKGKEKVNLFKCYCGTDKCNHHYPLCKWLRAADPSWTDPYGCVEDDTFPSKKKPNIYKGLIYNRLDGEEVPKDKPAKGRSMGGRTCDDEINDIYNGLKEIQKLLRDEL